MIWWGFTSLKGLLAEAINYLNQAELINIWIVIVWLSIKLLFDAMQMHVLYECTSAIGTLLDHVPRKVNDLNGCYERQESFQVCAWSKYKFSFWSKQSGNYHWGLNAKIHWKRLINPQALNSIGLCGIYRNRHLGSTEFKLWI